MPFDRQGTQQGQRNDAGQDWYGSSEIDFRSGQPAFGILRAKPEIVEADAAHQAEGRPGSALGHFSRVVLAVAFEFPDQPCSPQQRIARNRAKPGQQGVGSEPVEPASPIRDGDHYYPQQTGTPP